MLTYRIPVYFGSEIFSQILRFSALSQEIILQMCRLSLVHIGYSQKEFLGIFAKIFCHHNKPVYSIMVCKLVRCIVTFYFFGPLLLFIMYYGYAHVHVAMCFLLFFIAKMSSDYSSLQATH